MDVEVNPDSEWSVDTDRDATLFVYILQGEGSFGSDANSFIPAKNAVLFDKGDKFKVKASDKGIRFILMSGSPLREPIAWGGPIVMNTQEELDSAFRELEENNFIK